MKIVKTIDTIIINNEEGNFIIVSKGGDFGEVLDSEHNCYRVKIKGYDIYRYKSGFTKPVEGAEKIMRILYNV